MFEIRDSDWLCDKVASITTDDHLNLIEWMNFLTFCNKYEKKNKTKQQTDFFEPNLVGSPGKIQ